MLEDITQPAQEGAVEVIEGVQREQGHRIVRVESAVTALTERVAELERDNRRLRDTASVKSKNGGNGNGGNRGNGNRGNGGNRNGGNGGNGNGGNGENRNHANPARLQDAIHIANQLMDKKLQGYAARSAENKRRMETYAAGNNEKRGYAGPHPLRNKCRYHHVGPCTVKCNKCKRVGVPYKRLEDLPATVPNIQRAPLGNHQGVICYECGRPGHVKR
ncbi:hypothetical protein Tco_1130681 [Tanacetum coccineum]